jgi:hypothetical protein
MRGPNWVGLKWKDKLQKLIEQYTEDVQRMIQKYMEK